jgi:hypothetical protein
MITLFALKILAIWFELSLLAALYVGPALRSAKSPRSAINDRADN